MAAIRRALRANFFAAAQRGRVVRVGAGSGGGWRNARPSRAHARISVFMGPAIWRRNQPNQVFFLFFVLQLLRELGEVANKITRLSKKFSRWQKNISHFYQTGAHTTRFFILYRTYLSSPQNIVFFSFACGSKYFSLHPKSSDS